jgi:hypothetical protein
VEVRVALDGLDERRERRGIVAEALPRRLELGETLAADRVLGLERVEQRRRLRPRSRANRKSSSFGWCSFSGNASM